MGTLVVCGHGRRRARPTRAGTRRAAPQHPDADRADRRHVLELRERELLPVRVHAHVHAHRARDRGGRRARHGRRARERVAALRARAHRGARGLVVEVRHARGDPQPPRGARPLRRAVRRAPDARVRALVRRPLSRAGGDGGGAGTAGDAGARSARMWLARPGGAPRGRRADPRLSSPAGLARSRSSRRSGRRCSPRREECSRDGRRWWLWPPVAAGLWVAAWLAHGLVQDAAGLALIALACVAAASAADGVAPASSIRAGLVALAALDVRARLGNDVRRAVDERARGRHPPPRRGRAAAEPAAGDVRLGAHGLARPARARAARRRRRRPNEVRRRRGDRRRRRPLGTSLLRDRRRSLRPFPFSPG